MKETSDVSIDKNIHLRKKFYVYILFSLKDKGFYIGFTKDLKQRFTKHFRGEVKATKFRRPLKLIHYEYFISEETQELEKNILKVDMVETIRNKC